MKTLNMHRRDGGEVAFLEDTKKKPKVNLLKKMKQQKKAGKGAELFLGQGALELVRNKGAPELLGDNENVNIIRGKERGEVSTLFLENKQTKQNLLKKKIDKDMRRRGVLKLNRPLVQGSSAGKVMGRKISSYSRGNGARGVSIDTTRVRAGGLPGGKLLKKKGFFSKIFTLKKKKKFDKSIK